MGCNEGLCAQGAAPSGALLYQKWAVRSQQGNEEGAQVSISPASPCAALHTPCSRHIWLLLRSLFQAYVRGLTSLFTCIQFKDLSHTCAFTCMQQ